MPAAFRRGDAGESQAILDDWGVYEELEALSKHPKIPLAIAQVIAGEILTWLSPVVETAEIAGSIRRKKPEVSDIEIVCIPKIEETTIDLFGNSMDTRNLLDALCYSEIVANPQTRRIVARPDVNHRHALGQRYKRLVYGRFGYPFEAALDLFSVIPPAQWGVIMAIRTGPAEFSRKLVTQKSKGGLLPDNMRVTQGALWEDNRRTIYTPNEQDFFKAIGQPYLEPEER